MLNQKSCAIFNTILVCLILVPALYAADTATPAQPLAGSQSRLFYVQLDRLSQDSWHNDVNRRSIELQNGQRFRIIQRDYRQEWHRHPEHRVRLAERIGEQGRARYARIQGWKLLLGSTRRGIVQGPDAIYWDAANQRVVATEAKGGGSRLSRSYGGALQGTNQHTILSTERMIKSTKVSNSTKTKAARAIVAAQLNQLESTTIRTKHTLGRPKDPRLTHIDRSNQARLARDVEHRLIRQNPENRTIFQQARLDHQRDNLQGVRAARHTLDNPRASHLAQHRAARMIVNAQTIQPQSNSFAHHSIAGSQSQSALLASNMEREMVRHRPEMRRHFDTARVAQQRAIIRSASNTLKNPSASHAAKVNAARFILSAQRNQWQGNISAGNPGAPSHQSLTRLATNAQRQLFQQHPETRQIFGQAHRAKQLEFINSPGMRRVLVPLGYLGGIAMLADSGLWGHTAYQAWRRPDLATPGESFLAGGLALGRFGQATQVTLATHSIFHRNPNPTHRGIRFGRFAARRILPVAVIMEGGVAALDIHRYQHGTISRKQMYQSVSNAGIFIGMTGGGALVGSFIPVVGTGIGATIGAVASLPAMMINNYFWRRSQQAFNAAQKKLLDATIDKRYGNSR